jgi:hypothetical protein
MNNPRDEELMAELRSVLPPMGGQALEKDLWPRMLKRMERQPVRLNWFDWVLAGAAAAGFAAFPAVIPWVLFQC